MPRLTLIWRYTAFAVLSTLANLATQRVVLHLDESPLGFTAAILAGTAVGLALKYVLDKRWIFYDTSTGLKAHGQKFTLYALMGVVTTVIFWGTETLFWVMSQSHTLREVGAIIGLAIGYTVKYNLDSRFVFQVAGTRDQHPAS